jgi:hypothetical protein
MRLSLVRMVSTIALVLGAVLLTLLGLGLWLWALYIFALRYLPPDTAALATGAATFLGAGVLAWIATRLNR